MSTGFPWQAAGPEASAPGPKQPWDRFGNSLWPIPDGEFEARLVALSRGDPPEGRAQWSLRLLADKAVELGYIDSVSHETVRRVPKKAIKPWRRIGWVIPPQRCGLSTGASRQRQGLGCPCSVGLPFPAETFLAARRWP